jgi:hypothetical protein
MEHPLLIKVLEDAWWDATPEAFDDPGAMLHAAIPPILANRMEYALDICQWYECGRTKDHRWHWHDEDFEMPHEPEWACHAFQSL